MTNSTKITVAAPMSYSGSLGRLRRWLPKPGVFWTLGLLLLLIWWVTITAWYICFGLLLVPYRLVRRGARRRRLEDARHQELLEASRR